LPEALDPEQRYVLYVASAHPPDASGIPDLFTAMLQALRPLERLVVVGGVCSFFDEWLRNGGPADLARGRLILMDDVSDLCLDGLITNAKGFVLPLLADGGSNPKTADALYSGLPLVATTIAMRGYEAFRQMDGVILVDDAVAFAIAMRDILEMRLPHRSPGPALEALLWVNILRPIVQLVATVLAEHTAPRSA
jgi:glycosyltransferase involved in cell wall biosynthesis